MLAAQMRLRTAQARAVAQEFQRSPQFLRPDETARLKEIVEQGGDKALALAGAIVKGADSDAPAVLRQISTDAPLLAQAGLILSNGGSIQAARDAFKAAEIKRATGKELPGLPPQVELQARRDTLGTAFALQPGDGQRIAATAESIAKTRIAAAGLDPKGSEAQTIHKRALQEAAGGVFVDGVQYGGIGSVSTGWFSSTKVMLPAGLRADRFRDVIRSLRDEDFAGLPSPPQGADGKPYRARDFADAVPVAVRGGYRFAQGDPLSSDPRYIRGADGRPFVLPWEQVEPLLRSRMPGAFLGGR